MSALVRWFGRPLVRAYDAHSGMYTLCIGVVVVLLVFLKHKLNAPSNGAPYCVDDVDRSHARSIS